MVEPPRWGLPRRNLFALFFMHHSICFPPNCLIICLIVIDAKGIAPAALEWIQPLMGRVFTFQHPRLTVMVNNHSQHFGSNANIWPIPLHCVSSNFPLDET